MEKLTSLLLHFDNTTNEQHLAASRIAGLAYAEAVKDVAPALAKTIQYSVIKQYKPGYYLVGFPDRLEPILLTGFFADDGFVFAGSGPYGIIREVASKLPVGTRVTKVILEVE